MLLGNLKFCSYFSPSTQEHQSSKNLPFHVSKYWRTDHATHNLYSVAFILVLLVIYLTRVSPTPVIVRTYLVGLGKKYAWKYAWLISL